MLKILRQSQCKRSTFKNSNWNQNSTYFWCQLPFNCRCWNVMKWLSVDCSWKTLSWIGVVADCLNPFPAPSLDPKVQTTNFFSRSIKCNSISPENKNSWPTTENLVRQIFQGSQDCYSGNLQIIRSAVLKAERTSEFYYLGAQK